MVAIVFFVLLWAMPIVGHATTYYVSTTGNDANAGTDIDAPKRTVAHCVSIMVAGDTCYVRGGSYNSGVIRFSRTGTVSAPIVLSNYPGERPIITFQSFSNLDRILIQHSGGVNKPMGWITIQGFELTGGHDGIKFHSLHDSIIRNNEIHHVGAMGIMGQGGIRVLFERNIFHHNGRFTACDEGKTLECWHDHGIYAHGQSYTVRNNIFYWHQGYGISQNGSASSGYNPADHPGPEYAGAKNWIVESNTFAYSRTRAGHVVWGSECDGTRIENNIFYENGVELSNSSVQGVSCSSCSPSTGIQIRNNHFYGSGSGATVGIGPGFNADLITSGNVINVSAPAFVNGGSNSLPASPDFRLTASAPVNIARANEFTNNATMVVGAYKTVGTPTASIATNKIRIVLPLSTAVPVQNLSSAGVSFVCTANVCPGSPVVSSVSRVPGTDSQIEIVLSGITSNACLSHTDAVTVSYSSSTGAWTGNDNVGPHSGFHQKILSFTSVPVTNQCTGSGPPSSIPSHISYPMENGSGTTVSDTSGNGLHATTSGTWVSGKTGFGIQVASGTTQQTTIPWGSGVNPSTQSMTWVVPVFIPTGQTSTTLFLFGSEIGSNQRGYIGATSGTWRIARQSTGITAAGSSNLAVTEGWNHLCVRWDSSTDTVTLYKNGVTGTGGATGSYTSYTLSTNFEFPIIGTNLHTTVPEYTFDDVQVFTSLQDCASLYADWNTTPPNPTGTLRQTAIQFQGVILDTSSSPIVVGASVQTIEVPAGGGATILFQIHCENIADCDETAFKLVYANSVVPTTYQQVPNTETADGTWMWGVTTALNQNTGTRTTRLTGSCAVTNGTTQVTSDQVPSIDLPQDGCVVLAYIVRVGSSAVGTTFEYRLLTEAGLSLTGGYDQIARIKVVNPMASGIGF